MSKTVFAGLFSLSILVLAGAIGLTFVNDETLYDRILLPATDPRHLPYPDDPIIFSDPTVYFTLVIPAYNEEFRLPQMLNLTIPYLQSRESANSSFTWEVIIVDDGSKDRTCDVVLSYRARYPNVRLLKQPMNMGKGAAIQAGCFYSRGRVILMADADGATKIEAIAALEQELFEREPFNKEAVILGSRYHLKGSPSKVQRTALRKLLSVGFHILTVISGVNGVQDTQCGFKLFTREAARWLFPNQHIQRWCFDAELLVIARRRGMEIAEVPVEWNEIGGSKLKVQAMVKMAIDLAQIAVFHRTGAWNVKTRKTVEK
jgi:dolichyl-phosphate beta-glucosyltransferase